MPESAQPSERVDQEWIDWYSLWTGEQRFQTLYDGRIEKAAFPYQHELPAPAGIGKHSMDVMVQ